jgi:glycosyltransferase involved in cell wall biosynthesis
MLVGTPIVATSVDGVPDAIGAHGERGLGVPPSDATALARAVTTVLSDEVATMRMMHRALAWATVELSDERMVTGIMSVYKQLGLET